MNIVFKGFKGHELVIGLRIIKQYESQFCVPERMGHRKGVIYTSQELSGFAYVYHTKTQIVAIHK